MAERVILISAAVLVGLLLVYSAMVPPPPSVVKSAQENSIAPPEDPWFQETVVASNVPVIVDFKADWCGPCRMIHPHLVKLEEEFRGQLKVVEVDVDERKEIALHYKVDGIPVVMVMIQGKIVDGFQGTFSYDELKSMMLPHLAALPAEINGEQPTTSASETLSLVTP